MGTHTGRLKGHSNCQRFYLFAVPPSKVLTAIGVAVVEFGILAVSIRGNFVVVILVMAKLVVAVVFALAMIPARVMVLAIFVLSTVGVIFTLAEVSTKVLILALVVIHTEISFLAEVVLLAMVEMSAIFMEMTVVSTKVTGFGHS